MSSTYPNAEACQPATNTSWTDRVAQALPWLGALLLWMLMVRYTGLFHDAWLYTVQALGHLRPDLYQNDIFLRLGSQDRYTIFSPLYSFLIGRMDVEPAAALLTFVFQMAVLASAWLLARSFGAARTATLSLALLVALPSDYGPGYILHYLEGFITPRLPAEALVLAAIALVLARRVWTSAALLAMAFVVHPVIAASGIAVAAALVIGPRHPRLFAGLCAAFMLVVVLVGLLLPQDSPLYMDPTWSAIVHDHAPYIFITDWSVVDWIGPVGTLTALAVSWVALEPGPARRLCLATLFVTAYCLVLNFLGNDVFHISIIAQAQGYRSLWLAGCVTVLLMPLTASRLWKSGNAGQATLLMLAAFWLMRQELHALLIAPCALLGAIVMRWQPTNERTGRPLLLGARTVLLVCALIALANNVLNSSALYDDTTAPEHIDRLRTFLHDRMLPMALVLLLSWASLKVRDWRVLVSITSLLVGGVLYMAPVSFTEWTHRDYSVAQRAPFEAWRRHIPVGAEVLWYEAPMHSWILLERPSYFSTAQTGTALFSRPAAMVLAKRDLETRQYAFYARLAFPKDTETEVVRQTLKSVCATTTASFVVSRADLGARPLEPAPTGVSRAYSALNLYQCDRATS